MGLQGRQTPTAWSWLCVLGLLLAGSGAQESTGEGCGSIISARGDDGVWGVNEEGLGAAENSFQRVVDCVPAGNSLFLELSTLTVQETVNITSSLKIEGKAEEEGKVTVQCGGGQPLFDITGTAVEISNIRIIGCQLSAQRGALHVHEKSQTELKDVTCSQGLNTLGPACVSVDSGTVRIFAGAFRSNQGVNGGVLQAVGNSSIFIRNSNFTNNVAFSAGGALNLQESDVDISGATFSKNTGNAGGGAIKGVGEDIGLTLLITRTNFAENLAGNSSKEADGGAMSIEGALATVTMNNQVGFTGNKASHHGGSIFAMGIQRLSMTGGIFTGNNAEVGQGSALYLENSDILNLRNLKFNGNFGSGAALHVEADVEHRTSIKINATKFEGNTGNEDNGGAVALLGHMDVEVENSEFDGNQAGQGGAMMMFDSINVNVTRCRFVANKAQLIGGAVAAKMVGANSSSSVVFSDVQFVNNTARAEESIGGALSLEGVFLNVDFLGKLLFKDNAAGSGGGIWMDDVAAVTMNDAQFETNRARQDAGGAFKARDIGNFVSTSCTFKDNSGEGGGAIDFQAVNNPDMEASIRNAEFQNNWGNLGNGGAISFRGPGKYAIRNAKLTGSSGSAGGAIRAANVQSLSVESCEFRRNDASVDGGAISAQADQGAVGKLVITKTEFIGNAAGAGSGEDPSSGGAVHLSGQNLRTEIMDGVKFKNNTARTEGGALVGMGGNLKAGNVIFEENKANFGGACVLERVTSNITAAQFEKNSALTGGALVLRGNTSDADQTLYETYISRDTVFSKNLAIDETKNTTQPMAGALFVMRGIRLIMKKSKFLGNEAKEGLAGAMAVEGLTDIIMENIDFEGNSAEHTGSLSLMRGATCHIGGRSKFISNSGEEGCGAIGLSQKSNLTLMGATFRENAAKSGLGGAIGVKGVSSIYIDDSTFTNNTAAAGGAISIQQEREGTTSAICNMSNTQFVSNFVEGPSEETPPYGGAIYASGAVNISQNNVNYKFNTAIFGGGIYAKGSIVLDSKDGLFLRNYAAENGGALMLTSGTLPVLDSRYSATIRTPSFLENRAGYFNVSEDVEGELLLQSGRGGAIAVQGAGIDLMIFGSTFDDNEAGVGGAISWANGQTLRLVNGHFYRNKASLGGAIAARIPQSAENNLAISIANMDFRNNSAIVSGAVSIERSQKPVQVLLDGNPERQTNVELKQVTFYTNTAMKSCGAISIRQTLMIVSQTTFQKNSAGSMGDKQSENSQGGSICVTDSSWLFVTGSSFLRNKASIGGAMYVANSLIEVNNTEYVGNQASEGGAIAQSYQSNSIQSKVSLSRYNGSFVAQNSADVGGGIHITLENFQHVSCEELDKRLLSSDLGVENINIEELIGACQSDGTVQSNRSERFDFLATTFNNNQARSGAAIFSNDPTSLFICCGDSCAESQLSRSPCNGTEQGVVWKQDIEESSIVSSTPTALKSVPKSIQDHTSGQDLEFVTVNLVDEFGQDAIGDDVSLTVRIISPAGFEEAISGSAVTGVIVSGGTAIVSGIRLQAPPGEYTLQLAAKPRIGETLTTNLKVTVRPCRIGEVENDNFCTLCSGNFYSFDSKGKCLACPNNALCNASTLVPRDGFWQPTSWTPTVVPCLFKDACSFKRNGEDRAAILSKEAEKGALEEHQIGFMNMSLCTEGYENVLCGSCSAGFGKLRSLECGRCQGYSSSLFGFIFVSLWLWFLAGMLIRKSLAWANEVTNEVTEETISVEVFDYEISKNRASEIAKIIINFFQTTGIAWSVNQNWTRSIVNLLLGLDTASGIAYGNVSSLDCLFGGSRETRTLLSIVVPMYVPLLAWVVFVIFWLGVASVKRMHSEDFINRTIISMLALLFVYFISTAKRLARLLYCIEVNLLPGSGNTVEVWAEDTRFTCFEDDHLKMLTIGAPMGFATCVAFPLWIIIYLRRNKHRFRDQSFIKRYGFLYKSYRPNAEYWEVVIFARKALLAFIVVNAEPLGVDLQGTLAVGVLVIALIVQTNCRPFKKGLSRLNTLEFISLTISTFVFLSGLIFDSPKTSAPARIMLSIAVFGGILIFMAVLFLEMVFAGMKVLTLWAENHGFIDRNIGASQNCAKAVGVLRAHIQGLGRSAENLPGLELVVTETRDGPAIARQPQGSPPSSSSEQPTANTFCGHPNIP